MLYLFILLSLRIFSTENIGVTTAMGVTYQTTRCHNLEYYMLFIYNLNFTLWLVLTLYLFVTATIVPLQSVRFLPDVTIKNN
jgi:hypothetical protein